MGQFDDARDARVHARGQLAPPDVRRVDTGRQRALELLLARRILGAERGLRASGDVLSIEAVVTAIQMACGYHSIVLTQETWADEPGGCEAGDDA